MFSNTYFTTGEMLDFIKSENGLYFRAISGKYCGQIVSFHDAMQWLMWKDDNTYIPISFNNEFMKTKWRLLEMQHAYVINAPIIDSRKVYITYH